MSTTPHQRSATDRSWSDDKPSTPMMAKDSQLIAVTSRPSNQESSDVILPTGRIAWWSARLLIRREFRHQALRKRNKTGQAHEPARWIS
jgi:hypothetical protein